MAAAGSIALTGSDTDGGEAESAQSAYAFAGS